VHANEIALSEQPPSQADVVAVARRHAKVTLSAKARTTMNHSASLVDQFVTSGQAVYGVTTGFGALANTSIPAARTAELQSALVRSHAAGMGDEVETEVVRAMLMLRARSLAYGFSGVRTAVVETQLALLNAGVTPIVHEHGSLGASGDLAPLSHCALVLLGEGAARLDDGTSVTGAEALAASGVAPLQLRAKEGLALINGTDGMLGMLVLALDDLRQLLRVADVAGHQPSLCRRPAGASTAGRPGGQCSQPATATRWLGHCCQPSPR
jgi:histidine ammonia-lyase